MDRRAVSSSCAYLAALVGLLAGCGGDPSADGSADGSGETATDGGSETAGECEIDLSPCADAGVCLAGDCVEPSPCSGDACTAGPTFTLADTNLRVCYGASPDGSDGTIACPGTPGGEHCGGTDYCGGDAQYGWDVDHQAGERFELGGGDEPVVGDLVTGLEWQRCAIGQSGSDCAGEATRVTWYEADSYCADASWGGYDDWVLPSAYALQSITDYGRTSPAIDLGVFVNAPSSFAEDPDQWWIECAWSSSDYAGDPEVAWAVMVNNGDVSQGSGLDYHLHDKAAEGWEGCYARCVRAPTPVQWQRFIRVEPLAGEPIVADLSTGLIWQGCSYGQTGSDCQPAAPMLGWRSALAECESLGWGGYDDWRLPNVKELRSIVDDRVVSPAIDAAVFPNTPYYGVGMTDTNVGQYWSSTGRSYNSFALYVDFGTGFSHFYVQDESRHVRCVRDP